MNKCFTDIATFVSQQPSVKTDAFLACAGMGLCGEGPASGDLASMQMTGPFASSASLFGFLLEERLQTAIAKVEVINRLMLGCLHPIASENYTARQLTCEEWNLGDRCSIPRQNAQARLLMLTGLSLAGITTCLPINTTTLHRSRILTSSSNTPFFKCRLLPRAVLST